MSLDVEKQWGELVNYTGCTDEKWADGKGEAIVTNGSSSIMWSLSGDWHQGRLHGFGIVQSLVDLESRFEGRWNKGTLEENPEELNKIEASIK